MNISGHDLFQIAQMQDIYFTLHMWSILSPQEIRTSLKTKRQPKNGKVKKRSVRAKPK